MLYLAFSKAMNIVIVFASQGLEVNNNQTLALSEESYVSENSVISSTSTLSKASTNLSKLSSSEGKSFTCTWPSSANSFPLTGSFEISTDGHSVALDDDSYYYSIWVSYAEIYNEFIYDLLGDPPVKGKSRTSLKLVEDKHHNLFIKGNEY